jgi:hypothetical protein
MEEDDFVGHAAREAEVMGGHDDAVPAAWISPITRSTS